MSHLAVNQGRGRRRALSVNSYSEDQQHAMENALDNLRDDLSLVKSQWNRVLTEDSNPLELALAFLDDTSVGLGHRYIEFNQLKEQIGSHLQEVVNQHSQAFNSNVASYTQAVNAITKSQQKILELKDSVREANHKFVLDKSDLEDLNNQSLKYNQVIEDLNSIEKLIQYPDIIEEHIRGKNYRDARILLEKGFLLAGSQTLKDVSAIKPLVQQLELQEHVLFNTIIEEIHNILYSKNDDSFVTNEIARMVGTAQTNFSTLENYVYNVVNIDIKEQSRIINDKFSIFMKDIEDSKSYSKKVMVRSKQTVFDKLFIYLSLLKDMKKLSPALNIIYDRSKEEFHNIVLKSTEKVRLKHPSLLKMSQGFEKELNFGLSIKDILSLIMRECFWEIFIKFLVATQGHRVVAESVNSLRSPTSKSTIYPLDKVWRKVIDEIEFLLTRYLRNDQLLNSNKLLKTKRSRASSIANNRIEHFSLEDNIEGEASAKKHAAELKTLLKDIFPGFTVSSNMELGSIYIQDESFERDDSLIPGSIFNIKVLLEPYLVYVSACENILPEQIKTNTISPLKFFKDYMENQFFPNIEVTFNSLFENHVENNNPYALEINDENKTIFKAAVDFQNLLARIMLLMNTTNTFRKNVSTSILEVIIRLQAYYEDLFNTIVNSHNDISNNILITWLNDEKLSHLESKIYNGDESVITQETNELFRYVPNFCVKSRGLTTYDSLSPTSFDNIIYFLSTIMWILDWLPTMKKRVEEENNVETKSEIDILRKQWSFFETTDSDFKQIKTLKFSLDKESEEKFDQTINAFMQLKTKLVSLLRFDMRSLCISNIGELFQNTTMWNPEDSSNEIDQSIASLISRLRLSENKLKQQLSDVELKIIFIGVDKLCNIAFIKGSQTIKVLNSNGVKKLSRNIQMLQHTFRNFSPDPSNIDMSEPLLFYSLCDADESTLFEELNKGSLANLPVELHKTILKLQFSEELYRQQMRSARTSTSTHSKPTNKRYLDAMEKLNNLGVSTAA